MHYGKIKYPDIANGEGVRVSLFVSGCRIHCKGCFNSETWNFCYGKEFTQETEDKILELLSKPFIAGLTVLGGEPFEKENQYVLVKFLHRVKEKFPNKNIWCYSGYIYDQDIKPKTGKQHCEVTEEMLSYIDILIDGPFVQELYDISLQFRGSSNQRILKLH